MWSLIMPDAKPPVMRIDTSQSFTSGQ
jgi:hypothetical protein